MNLLLAVALAAVLGVVLSAAYYGLVPHPNPGSGDRAVTGPPTPVIFGIEFARSAAVAILLGGLIAAGDWTTAMEGALVGLSLWTMPAVLFAGSVVHEGTPPRVAALHLGDWLIKLLAVGTIIGWLG